LTAIKTGVNKKKVFDPTSISEFNLHQTYGAGFLYRFLDKWITIAERARNVTATRENPVKSP